MPTPKDENLYQDAKDFIMSRYKKYSAFASGAIVKKYKELFRKKYGEKISPYADDNKPKNLARWFEEKWVDVNPLIGITDDDAYPVFRPTKKVNSKTPTLYQEIPKSNLKEQFKRKQKLKGSNKNLPEFEKKGSGMKEVLKTIDKHLTEHIREAKQGKDKLDPKDLKHHLLIQKALKGGMIVQSFPNHPDNQF